MPSLRCSYVFGFLVLILTCSFTQAALLPASGGSPNGGGTSSAPTGTLVGSVTSPFIGADVTGTVTTNVYSGDSFNALGGLTFVYTVHNNTGSVDSLGRATVNDFAGVSIDASTNATSGVVPSLVNRSGSGDVVGWNFQDINGANTLGANLSSVPLVLRTNSLNFAPNIASVIDGSASQVAGLGPASGILPEPATMALLSLAGAFLARRR